MSFVLNKAIRATANGAAQADYIEQQRRIALNWERGLAQMAGLEVNALPNLDPRAWLEMDATTVQQIGQEADVLFTDLNGLSTPIPIGKIVAAYRRGGSMDQGDTSLTGQTTGLMGQVSFDYDGVVIPIHKKPFGLQWREVEGNRSIGYDVIADNQQAAVREVTRLKTVNLISGNPNLNYQGAGSFGLLTSPNTLAVQLGVDFTSQALTFGEADAAFGAFIQNGRAGTNRVTAPFTVYISPEIEANLSRRSGAQSIDRTWLAVLAETPGVAAIKTSYLLQGNQMLAVVLNRQFVEVKTGAPINTVPVPRNHPMADYQWLTWSASGLLVKADADGRTGVLLGSS